jgi:HAD superfamily hydrolase (TIGR01484 family)
MKALSQLPDEALVQLRGVLFDLDDTLLDGGRLTLDAYRSLFELEASGLELFAVTGRPAAWGAVLARQWPVSGAVTENGAIGYYRDGERLAVLDRVAPEERKARSARLQALVRELSREFSELVPADDVDARLSDFTFDVGEHRKVAPAVTARARRFAGERGARSHVSSVHLHVSFDADDKATGALRLLHASRGVDPTSARYRYAFVGDSQNDEACFNAFELTIAVKNFSGQPTRAPRYVTQGERAAGFVELARRITRARAGHPAHGSAEKRTK